MAKVNPLSPKAKDILEVLRTIKSGTMAEISANGAEGIVSGNFTALRVRGLVSTEKMPLVCECCGNKKEVTVYTITEAGEAYVEPTEEVKE